MIRIFAEKFIQREYKFKYLIYSVISGILLSLSFEKFNCFFMAWIAFIPFIECINKQNLARSFLYGFAAGLTYSLISFNWMFPFLLKNTVSFRDSIVISAVVWLYISLYFSIWAGLISFVKENLNKFSFIVFSSALWVVFEFARNYILSGFPVNLVGYSQAFLLPVIQAADIAGVYGISFIIICVNITLYFWLKNKNKNKKYLIYSVLILSFLFVYGFIRMHQFDSEYGKKITIGVVQPDIKQYKKWKEKYKRGILNILRKKAAYFKDKKTDIILYPETVLPGKIQNDELIQNLIKEISPYADLNLIGGKYYDGVKVYNSIFLINRTANIIDKYKKKHLVIFGEYIPFKGLLNNLFAKNTLFDDFAKEEILKVFQFENYTLGINICSENFYPYLSRQLVLNGADILTTHSNDSWCDGLFYPEQHFVMNIFRAIENRKTIIIASNTGISGIINCKGKILKKTKNEEGICFAADVYTNNYLTIYDITGDMLVYACMFLSLFFLFLALFFKIKKQI